MIITRTPLRISLAGGGSDMPAFYERECGVVVNFTVNKYIYVTVNDKFDGRTRVSYSRTENVDFPTALQHDLARECLNYYHMRGLEITTVSDIPGEGTGLGSSSAFTVGLCQALSYKRGESLTQAELAERAFLIERTLCGHPVGKQDHYAAAFGGLSRFNFRKDFVNHFPMGISAYRLENSLMFFWTGVTRRGGEILREQEKNIGDSDAGFKVAGILRDLAVYLCDYLRTGEYDMLGQILREGWEAKKSLASGISAEWIDRLYNCALEAGASGGKLCGAGGGGFLLFAVPKEKRDRVERALGGLRRVPFKIEPVGARVIYSD